MKETAMRPENRIHGRCGCGKEVTKIEHSARWSMRADGVRYVYTDQQDRDVGACIFRCEQCGKPIDETFCK